MFKNLFMQKREKYIETMLNIYALPESEEKSTKLSKLMTEYRLYCYKHNLESFDDRLNKASGFIVPSKPIIYELNGEETMNAVEHLKEALETGSGITEEEAETLLKWSVGKAREVLANGDIESFKKDSLNGCCGESQALTLLPFINIGADVTINNVKDFPHSPDYHAFGTVELPILKDGIVTYERYLIDATYRQRYTIYGSNEGCFYNSDQRFKNISGPDAGFYTLKHPKGYEFATELLQKGYIKLNANNSKIYGIGFTCECLNKNNISNMVEYFKINEEEFYKVIIKGNYELDYNESEIKQMSELVNFPQNNFIR